MPADMDARLLALEARVDALENGRPRLPLTLAQVRREAVAGITKGDQHGAAHWRNALTRIVQILLTAEATTTEKPK